MIKRPIPYRKIVFVCTNQRAPGERVCCAGSGGNALRDKLKEMVKERGLKGKIRVSASGCQDRCEQGPNLMVFPDNAWYCGVKEEDLPALLDAMAASLDGG